MAYNPIIATPLRNIKHIQVFDELADTRFQLVDLENLLVNMFDTIDASLLDILAAQYDMLGYNGWILAENDQEKRELLKGAVGLHKMMGTAGGIREVIKRLGFLDVVIEEGWENFTDGSAEPPAAPWAHFRVVYILPGDKAITAELAQNLIGLINNYKNARSKLANFGFGIPQMEKIGIQGKLRLKIFQDDVLIEDTTAFNAVMLQGMDRLFAPFDYSFTEGDPYGFYSQTLIRKIAFGTSNTPVGDGANAGNLLAGFKKNFNSVNGVNWVEAGKTFRGNEIHFSLEADEANGTTIRELGFISESFFMNDTLYAPGSDSWIQPVAVNPEQVFNRIVRAPIVKTSAIRLEGIWTIGIRNL